MMLFLAINEIAVFLSFNDYICIYIKKKKRTTYFTLSEITVDNRQVEVVPICCWEALTKVGVEELLQIMIVNKCKLRGCF